MLIILAGNWIFILISRLLGGFAGGGCYMIIPLFISEISDDRFEYEWAAYLQIIWSYSYFRIRGRLGSVFILASGAGILFAYTCGTFFSYTTLPFIYIPLSLLFLIGTMFHPESAHLLVKKGENDVNINVEKGFLFFHYELESVIDWHICIESTLYQIYCCSLFILA